MTQHPTTYDYIISIDIGTTFSGSCFTSIQDENSIIHVVRWPEQQADDTFEKTPTACLYTKNPRELFKWGKAALDHMSENPNDDTVVLIDQFKLKLQNLFQKGKNDLQEEDQVYRTAAIDYLREVNKYTCAQITSTVAPSFSGHSVQYVLTVPATWINQDNLALREMAVEAGLIEKLDPKDRLLVINEAHAAALFCEREYCVTDKGTSKLFKGQRYLLCDAGGGTIDLATYECTGLDYKHNADTLKNEHCQLALESGGNCGSTILDQNMEKYLRDEIFIGCIEEKVLKSLVAQFVKDIKHYFGGNENRNNYITPIKKSTQSTEHVSTTLTTTAITKMLEVRENDYNYEEDYQDQHSDISMDEDAYIYDDDSPFDDEESYEDMTINNFVQENILLPTDYVYFTLPIFSEGPMFDVLNTFSLKGDVISHQDCQQLRISHADISKHVFDPVIETVKLLIGKQIKKSHTKIDTLFLLGGFGQSPYLYKKLHHEFITSTNMVYHLIVPENGYRASMRGGIYFGLDNSGFMPQFRDYEHPLDEKYNKYRHLIGIDFNFFDLSATFTLVKNIGEGAKQSLRKIIVDQDLETVLWSCQVFDLDSERFLEESYPYLVDAFHDYLDDINLDSPVQNELPSGDTYEKRIYYDCLIKVFIQQLYELMKHAYKSNFGYLFRILPDAQFRYTFAPVSKRQTTRNVQETSMEKLYSKLLSRLLGKDSVFTPNDAIKVHEYFKKITFEKALPVKNTDLTDMSEAMMKSASDIGMIQPWNSEKRFIWDGNYVTKPFLAYRYFFTPVLYTQVNNGTNNEVFTYYLNEGIKKFKVITCIDKETNQYKYQNKLLPLYNNNGTEDIFTESVFDYPNPQTVQKFIQSGEYTIEKLLPFLATRTTCMNVFISNYIKNNVNLSKGRETHSIKKMFFVGDTDEIINIKYTGSIRGIEYALNYFKDVMITTRMILSLLIEPWIEEVLAPSIVSSCLRHQSPDKNNNEFCLIFTGQIVKTKNYGLSECPKKPQIFQGRTWQDFYKGGETYTWSDYLFHILQVNLEKSFKSGYNTAISYRILYDNRPDYSRHVDSLMNGVIRYDRYKKEYTSNEEYVLHLLAFDVKPGQPSFWYKVGGMDWDFSDKKEEECLKTKANIVDGVSEEGLTCLYPLIGQRKVLVQHHDAGVESILKFVIPYECSIAAVVYSSKDLGHKDYNISNNSFKKLHRFIFPVKDATKPIVLGYSIEDTSLIINIKQDDYEADFKCQEPLNIS